MAANTVKANATADAADQADLAVGTNVVVGREGANIVAAQLVDAQITTGTITLGKVATQSDSGAFIFDASGVPAYLGPGNASDVLTSGGTGVIPSWAPPTGGAATDLATSGSNVAINSTAPAGAGYVLETTSATVATWQLATGGAASPRDHGVSVVTGSITANTTISGVTSANTDAALLDYSAFTFVTDVEIYINGRLMRAGANSGADFDVYPAGTDTDGDFACEFDLESGDTIHMFIGGGPAAGAGDVTAGANIGNEFLVRGDGAVKGVQNSGITVDDSDNITGAGTYNGVTVEPKPTLSKSLTLELPTGTELFPIFHTPVAITFTNFEHFIQGTTNVEWQIMWGATADAAGTATHSTIVTSSTSGVSTVPTTDPTIPADSYLWLDTSAISGTPDKFHVTITYTED
jgi:hypothetical protein